MGKNIEICYSGYSEYYVTEPLYQYDRGIVLQISGIALNFDVEVHFSYLGMPNAITSTPTRDGEYIVSKIPDVLMTKPNDVEVYIYVAQEDYGQTICHITVPIIQRARPDGYEYSQEEILGYNALLAQLQAATAESTAANQKANEATAYAQEAAQTADDAALRAQTAAETIDTMLDGKTFVQSVNGISPTDGNAQIEITHIDGLQEAIDSSCKVTSVNGETGDVNISLENYATKDYVNEAVAGADVDIDLSNYSQVGHTHTSSEVSGVALSEHSHALTDCTGTLSVAKGGTGATDAATARTNLGAAATSHGTHVTYGTSAKALGTSSAGSAATVSRSDHVHALPALTSCTGTLSINKGGTGATTASSALTNLGIVYTESDEPTKVAGKIWLKKAK